MGKGEFLDILGGRLIEELPRDLVIYHLRYYEEYITGELEKGRSLTEIMNELGDPILIAHTIINTETGESFQGYAEDAVFVEIPNEDDSEDSFLKEEDLKQKDVEYTHLDTESEEKYHAKEQMNDNMNEGRNNRIGCLIAGGVIVLLLLGILSLVGSIISVLLPILLPVLIIVILFSLIFGKKN